MPGKGKAMEYTLNISQRDFGHQAEKRTWLYICGVPMRSLPDLPLILSYPTGVIKDKCGKNKERRLRGKDRIATPPALAEWLLAVARLVPKDYTP